MQVVENNKKYGKGGWCSKSIYCDRTRNENNIVHMKILLTIIGILLKVFIYRSLGGSIVFSSLILIFSKGVAFQPNLYDITIKLTIKISVRADANTPLFNVKTPLALIPPLCT